MCTYNGSDFLHQQLQSIACQTLPPFELIVCDDGSTDGSVCLIREFAEHVSFAVRIVLNRTRLGATKNFEQAIRLCRGDVIALADQDDVWQPMKLQRLLESLEGRPGACYAFSDAGLIARDGRHEEGSLWQVFGFYDAVAKFSGAAQLRILLRQNVVTGAGMVFDASLRDIVLPIPSNWVHDHWIALLGSALFQGVPVPERLFIYRRHSGQLIGARKENLPQVVAGSLDATKDDSWRKLERFRALMDRIASVSHANECLPSKMDLLKEKEAHLSERATIQSTAGVTRIVRASREVMTGRYHLYSNSWGSIFRDLCR